jgi:hypothetical protein
MHSMGNEDVASRHERLQHSGTTAIVGWIGHPSVHRLVGAVRPLVRQLVAPLAMRDQSEITALVARAYDVTGYYPDGTEWPAVARWPRDRLDAARAIVPALVVAIDALASALEMDGVPLDPASASDRVALAQMALLEFDLTLPAAQLVEGLNALPPGGFERGGGDLRMDRHTSNRDERDLVALLRREREAHGKKKIRAVYAGGSKRRPPARTVELRRALRVLVAEDPSLTPTRLLEIVDGEEDSALVHLREILGWAEDAMPSEDRLRDNWPK